MSKKTQSKDVSDFKIEQPFIIISDDDMSNVVGQCATMKEADEFVRETLGDDKNESENAIYELKKVYRLPETPSIEQVYP